MSEPLNAFQEDKAAGADLKLDSSVRLITPKNNLLAFASLKIADCFVVDNIKIVAGEKGLFVDMPSAQDVNGKYHNIAFPVTAAFREKINATILDSYEAAVEKAQSIGEAQRGFTQKAPIADRLAAGKEKAAAYNAAKPIPTTPHRQKAESL